MVCRCGVAGGVAERKVKVVGKKADDLVGGDNWRPCRRNMMVRVMTDHGCDSWDGCLAGSYSGRGGRGWILHSERSDDRGCGLWRRAGATRVRKRGSGALTQGGAA